MRHASRTCDNVERDGTLIQALFEFQRSAQFREHPLQVRMIFQSIAVWMPDRERYFPLVKINASFAKRLRNNATHERGWRFGNHALVLIQAVVARSVSTGILTTNRVRQVPKLPPPLLPDSACRRRIQPIRESVSSAENLLKKENTSA